MARRNAKSKGTGSLEIHGRTYRAHYFKLDPRSPNGFKRVSESTGILADGSDPEDMGDPEKARKRADQWLEERSAPYRKFIEHGRFTEDLEKLQLVAKGELAKTSGMVQQAATDLAEASDKLPALTLEQAWRTFDADLESRKRDPATQRNYGQWYHLFTDWLKSTHPEATELRHVSPAMAREYAKILLGRVRGTTHNRHLNALALIWATLAARDINGNSVYPDAKLGGNPFAYDKATKSGIPRIKLVKADRPHKRRDLNLEEIALLLNRSEGELQTLIALGFYTGLRLGDCITLKVSHFDRALGVIRRRSSKTDIETEHAIHPCLAYFLDHNVTASRGYILPELAELYTADAFAEKEREEYAGPEEARERILNERITNRRTTGRTEISKRLEALFHDCGIETSFKEEGARARPEAGFHSLRHAYGTQLKRANVALSQRQAALGHATAAMTQYYCDHPEAGASLALPDLRDGEALKNGHRSASNTGRAINRADGTGDAGGTLERVLSMLEELNAADLKKVSARISKKLKKEVRNETRPVQD